MPLNRLAYHWIVVAAAGVLAAILGLWPVHVLVIEDMPARPVMLERVRPGQRLSLGFLHSVENCRVWDHLVIAPDDTLVVVATEFAESRTGLPYAAFGEEVFERRDDHFAIRNMARPVPAIYQWVDARYENTLRIDGGRDIPLAALAGNTLLHMRIDAMPAMRWVWLKTKLYWQDRSF